ncbi:A24 family peptidase [Asaia sp. HN010]|uniref:prepilin peptidase n=1 Tax=Asaia sp. HN010 TaxID=3081233 RepID=UPI003015FFD3
MMAFPSTTTALVIASPFIGSFLGVLAWRLPEGRSPFFNRSRCPFCNNALRAVELIPLVSYIVQKGRCRRCKAPIDKFHPLMEVAALLVAGSADLATHFDPVGDDPARIMAQGCLFGWVLLLLAAIDLRSHTLPDYLTQPLLGVGLLFAALQGRTNFHVHTLTALLSWLVFEGVATLYRALRRREGLGGGDAKLIAAGGGWLGPLLLPEIVCSAAIMTLIAAAISTRGRLRGAMKIPLGPGLALALWGGWLIETSGLAHG